LGTLKKKKKKRDWDKVPVSYEEPDNKSATENYGFVREEVARLVKGGQVVER
jgi:hypothetical protein